MAYPVDKETFETYVDRDLATGELGTRIEADDMNELRGCVERIEDAIGYNFLAGYSDLAERIDNLATQTSAFLWSLMGRIR